MSAQRAVAGVLAAAVALTLGGCAARTEASHGSHTTSATSAADDATAQLERAREATARYSDVALAEADGWASTLDTLGCFEDPEKGGMGVHYVAEKLMDDRLSVVEPEALVYEVDDTGEPAALVALEYIVPVEAWTSAQPPTLYGRELHRHPVLPLWVLHAWVHRDNPSGVDADFNPDVADCPAGVPVFGVDLP